MLLDQHFLPCHMCFPTLILEFLVHLLVSNFELLLHQCFQFVNYATLRATLPPFCGNLSPQHIKCHICGRSNHTTWYCFYNDKGPNYIGVHTNASYSPQSYYHLPPQNLQYNSSSAPSQHVSVTST